jgi:eukaryotic-like serine/threonine-protein kinase
VEIWFLGHNERGVRMLDAALARAPLANLPLQQRPYFAVATQYAHAGRPDRARTILAEYDAAMRDSALRVVTSPDLHGTLAEILLAEHRPLDAVREIWRSDSLPDGPAGDCVRCVHADLGRAYDMAGMPDSAIAHWETWLATPYAGQLGQDASMLPAVRKRLGELYEARGNTQRAAHNYLAFLELWKNADPELQPRVQEVRQRLARLKDVAGK